jgi:membrane protein
VITPLRERAETVRQGALELLDRRPLGRGFVALCRGLSRHHVASAASTMAFDLFLAAIPMLALAGWITAVALRRDPSALDTASLLLDVTPHDVYDLLSRQLGRFSPGAVAPIALLGSLWLASSAFHTLMSVFETALGVRQRPWWKKRTIAIGCVIAAICGFALTAFVAFSIAGGPETVFRLLQAGEGIGAPAGRVLVAVLALSSATAALAGFFRIAVYRPDVERRVWPGAVLTMAIGGLSSYLFSAYIKHLARLSLYYGSLTAVAIVLVWLWIWCLALLVGAELNAQLEGGER